MADLLSSLKNKSAFEEGEAVLPPRMEKMEDHALVFLEEPLARKLAVAWQTCRGDEDIWMQTAGIARAQQEEARVLAESLRANGICRDGGVTDALAIQYISAIVAAPIHRAKGGTKRGR